MKSTTKPRKVAAGVTLAAGLIVGLLVPGSAMAQTSLSQWQACLDGARPSTSNVAPGVSDHDAAFDEVILDFADSMSDEEIKALMLKQGLKVELNSVASDDPNIYVATVPEGAVPYIKDCLDRRMDSDVLEGVEENFEYSLFAEESAPAAGKPNDPLYQFQWNFKQVNAEEAWGTSTGRDVVVAVIDTGVAMTDAPNKGIKGARDLKGTEQVAGYDFVDKSDFVFDGHGHGTHVAGTIAQTTNNRYGVAGLAYNAKIMGLRVLNSQGFGQVADIADSIRWAADHDAQVINMSLGGPLPSLTMKRAIDYAHKKGVTIVAAAGNSGRRSPSYPAAYNHVIAVAATQFDRKTTFYSQWGGFVDIAAPGGNTRVDQNGDGRPDGVMQETIKDGRLDKHDFLLYMGTSMASPHVAAGAALIIAQGVTHPDKVEAILTKTSDDSNRDQYSSEKEYRERFGSGIMQADKAAKAAVLGQGAGRSATGAILLLLTLIGLRRRDNLGLGPKLSPTLVGATLMGASGLFFLPALVGDVAWLAPLTRPVAELDMLVFGLGWHQNPLMASFLLPLAAYGFLGGNDKLCLLAAGLALGMAGFCLSESVLLTSDVRSIPGMGMLDRAWLLGNGVVSLAIGYFGLKRR